MGDALSQSCGKHWPISRKSINTTMMTSTELIEISTAQILKDDSRMTSSGGQSNRGEEICELDCAVVAKELKTRFIRTEAVEGIE